VTCHLNYFKKKDGEERKGSKQDLQNKTADKVHVPVERTPIAFNLILGM
jgi:hypothetical protein